MRIIRNSFLASAFPINWRPAPPCGDKKAFSGKQTRPHLEAENRKLKDS